MAVVGASALGLDYLLKPNQIVRNQTATTTEMRVNHPPVANTRCALSQPADE